MLLFLVLLPQQQGCCEDTREKGKWIRDKQIGCWGRRVWHWVPSLNWLIGDYGTKTVEDHWNRPHFLLMWICIWVSVCWVLQVCLRKQILFCGCLTIPHAAFQTEIFTISGINMQELCGNLPHFCIPFCSNFWVPKQDSYLWKSAQFLSSFLSCSIEMQTCGCDMGNMYWTHTHAVWQPML